MATKKVKTFNSKFERYFRGKKISLDYTNHTLFFKKISELISLGLKEIRTGFPRGLVGHLIFYSMYRILKPDLEQGNSAALQVLEEALTILGQESLPVYYDEWEVWPVKKKPWVKYFKYNAVKALKKAGIKIDYSGYAKLVQEKIKVLTDELYSQSAQKLSEKTRKKRRIVIGELDYTLFKLGFPPKENEEFYPRYGFHETPANVREILRQQIVRFVRKYSSTECKYGIKNKNLEHFVFINRSTTTAGLYLKTSMEFYAEKNRDASAVLIRRAMEHAVYTLLDPEIHYDYPSSEGCTFLEDILETALKQKQTYMGRLMRKKLKEDKKYIPLTIEEMLPLLDQFEVCVKEKKPWKRIFKPE